MRGGDAGAEAMSFLEMRNVFGLTTRETGNFLLSLSRMEKEKLRQADERNTNVTTQAKTRQLQPFLRKIFPLQHSTLPTR